MGRDGPLGTGALPARSAAGQGTGRRRQLGLDGEIGPEIVVQVGFRWRVGNGGWGRARREEEVYIDRLQEVRPAGIVHLDVDGVDLSRDQVLCAQLFVELDAVQYFVKELERRIVDANVECGVIVESAHRYGRWRRRNTQRRQARGAEQLRLGVAGRGGAPP